MMPIRTFTVNINPVAKARPRMGKYGVYTPKKTAAYELAILAGYRKENIGKNPIDKPIKVSINCGIKMPKSWSKKKKAEMWGNPHTSKPDIDNLVKAVLDALNGVAFCDDSQIYEITSRKIWCDEPYVYFNMEW
jgi:Holliday junction resolvase RusA-like endonuclease